MNMEDRKGAVVIPERGPNPPSLSVCGIAALLDSIKYPATAVALRDSLAESKDLWALQFTDEEVNLIRHNIKGPTYNVRLCKIRDSLLEKLPVIPEPPKPPKPPAFVGFGMEVRGTGLVLRGALNGSEMRALCDWWNEYEKFKENQHD